MLHFLAMLVGCITIMAGFNFWLGLGLAVIFWALMLQNVRIAKIHRDNLTRVYHQLVEALKEEN